MPKLNLKIISRNLLGRKEQGKALLEEGIALAKVQRLREGSRPRSGRGGVEPDNGGSWVIRGHPLLPAPPHPHLDLAAQR